MSFTNSIVKVRNRSFLIVFIKSATKNKNRIDDKGEPCEILVSIVNNFDSSSVIFIVVFLSFRKLLIQFIIFREIPLCRSDVMILR